MSQDGGSWGKNHDTSFTWKDCWGIRMNFLKIWKLCIVRKWSIVSEVSHVWGPRGNAPKLLSFIIIIFVVILPYFRLDKTQELPGALPLGPKHETLRSLCSIFWQYITFRFSENPFLCLNNPSKWKKYHDSCPMIRNLGSYYKVSVNLTGFRKVRVWSVT